jgi:hypothetical protein
MTFGQYAASMMLASIGGAVVNDWLFARPARRRATAAEERRDELQHVVAQHEADTAVRTTRKADR